MNLVNRVISAGFAIAALASAAVPALGGSGWSDVDGSAIGARSTSAFEAAPLRVSSRWHADDAAVVPASDSERR